jgi:hypothetical protein
VRLSHDPAKTHASFDDPDLVSRAGMIPVMALAGRAGCLAGGSGAKALRMSSADIASGVCTLAMRVRSRKTFRGPPHRGALQSISQC